MDREQFLICMWSRDLPYKPDVICYAEKLKIHPLPTQEEYNYMCAVTQSQIIHHANTGTIDTNLKIL